MITFPIIHTPRDEATTPWQGLLDFTVAAIIFVILWTLISLLIRLTGRSKKNKS